MKSFRFIAIFMALFCACLCFTAAEAAIEADEARDIAEEAYVFGYPLLAMETSKWVNTTGKAGVNAFNHARTFPDASFTDIVSPNADTLYSQAWLDLSVNPVVLSVPDIDVDRYYVMQCLDAWTDVFTSVGTRETGNGKGEYLMTGPGWVGAVPTGMKHLESPTNLVWILGRTETRGKGDYDAVHKIQDEYGLRMLDPAAVAPVAPPGTDTTTPPSQQMDEFDSPDAFYSRICSLMTDNPPYPADKPLLDRMALLGMTPGGIYDASVLSEDIRTAIAEGFEAGRQKVIEESGKSIGTKRGVWSFMPDNIANFGTDYDLRAIIARVGIGANLPEEALYPSSRVDSNGNPLHGADKYTIRFEKGQLPPVAAFWSITMYNNHQFFVDNPIDRYTIGDRDALKEGDDGSVTIYVQNESPGEDLESNWLPAPKDGFNMIMRLYLPDHSILDGTWPVPELKKTSREGSGSSGCDASGAAILAALAGLFGLSRARSKKRGR